MMTIMMGHNRRDVMEQAVLLLVQNTEGPVWVLDNGSQEDLRGLGAPVVRLPENVGNYRAFVEALHFAESENADLVAIFHSDLFVYEAGWDRRVEGHFRADPLLGLAGFAASDKIDQNGGRGLGTRTNYQGRVLWSAKADVHGKRDSGFHVAAQVDGVSMVFRTEVLRAIGNREDFPPHHWYDRLMSCQVLEAGFRVAYVGVEVDHPGGTTTMFEQSYHDLAKAWCQRRGVSDQEQPGNWDLAVYREGERQFLREYRDEKHFIPLEVASDWSVRHYDR